MSTKTFDPPAFLSELSPKSKALWNGKVKGLFIEKDAAMCPTGGEYFFVPSIELLHLISGSTMQRIANKR
jgi:hypothetical protein